MTKVFRGFRFDLELYDQFCSIAQKKHLSATAALERFMAGCVASEQLVFADGRADFEAEARILMDWLGKGKHFYRNEEGEETSISGRLLALLPKIADPTLKNNIEEALKKSVPNSTSS